ncbi:uncharacterized protein PAC_18075 [Phialocephala subalpina]|uniref:Uncharacterized protein n=1 Tax=Phialocephala subalpina TaxID=576137 RepID=A0A1L7XT03_9HELO|nr:uncharacterized protein PAC_18075 [Phialocephala subalpina]
MSSSEQGLSIVQSPIELLSRSQGTSSPSTAQRELLFTILDQSSTTSKPLNTSLCHLAKLSDDILMLIFELIFTDYGICGATCFGLAHRQLYKVLKSFHPDPISLAARIESSFSRTNLNCTDNSTFYPGVCLGTMLKNFMAPNYRPANNPEYRYLPVAKYGRKAGSRDEEELEKLYVDEWMKQLKEGIKFGEPGGVLMPWETSSGRFWRDEECAIPYVSREQRRLCSSEAQVYPGVLDVVTAAGVGLGGVKRAGGLWVVVGGSDLASGSGVTSGGSCGKEELVQAKLKIERLQGGAEKQKRRERGGLRKMEGELKRGSVELARAKGNLELEHVRAERDELLAAGDVI